VMTNEKRELPSGWVWAVIDDVVVRMSNGTTQTQNKINSNSYAVTRIETISSGVIDLQRVGYLQSFTPEAVEKYRLLEGDVLFSHINSDTHLGKTAIFKFANTILIHGMNLLLLRINPGITTPEYFHYLCNHYRFSGRFISIAQHAVNQSSINQTKLKSVEIPLPPLPEQRRIVAKIETLFTRLDAGVAGLKRIQAQLKRYKASVLKAACEGKLVPQDPNDEPAEALLARILAERRAKWEADLIAKGKDLKKAKYEEPQAPDVSELPELPKGWIWATLEQLSHLITSGSRGWAEYYSNEGVLFIRAQDINTDELKLDSVAYVRLPSHVDGLRTLVFDKDILITITGANVTKTALVKLPLPEAYVSQHVALVRLVATESSEYVYFWIISPTYGRRRLEKAAYGAGKPGLSLINLKELVIALPPITEQRRIVAEVERRLSLVKELEQTVNTNLARAERLRQAILKRAFEGKLVAHDPADEPAERLLERVKALTPTPLPTTKSKSVVGRGDGKARSGVVEGKERPRRGKRRTVKTEDAIGSRKMKGKGA
jgi:type I restriction enzyme, S subunit